MLIHLSPPLWTLARLFRPFAMRTETHVVQSTTNDRGLAWVPLLLGVLGFLIAGVVAVGLLVNVPDRVSVRSALLDFEAATRQRMRADLNLTSDEAGRQELLAYPERHKALTDHGVVYLTTDPDYWRGEKASASSPAAAWARTGTRVGRGQATFLFMDGSATENSMTPAEVQRWSGWTDDPPVMIQ